MLSIWLLAAALNDQVTACSAAVHGDLTSAVMACDTQGQMIDIVSADGMTDACLTAFKAGQQAGRFGRKVPAVTRDAFIKDFDRKLFACQHPATPKQTPERKIVNLWD
jgi:hypothetical protein